MGWAARLSKSGISNAEQKEAYAADKAQKREYKAEKKARNIAWRKWLTSVVAHVHAKAA